MSRHRLILFAAVLVMVAACGDDAADDTTTTTEAAAATTTTAPATTTTVTTTTVPETTTTDTTLPDSPYLTIEDSEHGPIVTDDAGMTLYLFVPDDQGPSTCTGACAVTWPPLVGEVGAGPGIDPTLMDSVQRGDGTTQVTYNGWPLYYYAPDIAPGDTRGQGVGGVWFVVDAEGNAVS